MNTNTIQRAAVSAFALTLLLTHEGYADQTQPLVDQVQHCCDAPCDCAGSCCDSGCCGECCRKVCVATVEREKVEKHCWKTEAKDICVPKVVLPWHEGGSGLTLFSCFKKHKGCDGCGDACCGDACCSDSCCGNGCCPKPRCGKVKTVCDLKKEKYECEECVCKWEIRRLPPCCGDDSCCGANCGDACMLDCSAGIEATSTIRLTAVFDEEEDASDCATIKTADTENKSWLERLKVWK